MLAPQSKYALRALIYLSTQDQAIFLRVEQIAKITELPAPFLSKIFKVLTEKKIILSRRGKNGGVQLNRNEKDISFYDICFAVGDPIVHSECMLFKKPCDSNKPCAFHGRWSKTKHKFIDFLKNTKLTNKSLN